MKQSNQRRVTKWGRWALRCAIAATPLAAAVPAAAQVRDTGDGRALDANNRVGSGGYNDNTGFDNRATQNYTGNQIVTGNVTRGYTFRGPVPYTDSRSFRGPVAGSISDRFVRDSSGSAPDQTATGAPTAFYGRSRAVPPPAGFEREGFTGGYLRAPGAVDDPRSASRYTGAADTYSYDDPFARQRRDTLLVAPNINGNLADQAAGQSILSASPLYGVRQWGPTDANGSDLLNPRSGAAGATDRFGLSQNAIDRMRGELNEAANPADQRNGPNANQQQSGFDGTQGGAQPQQGLIQPLNPNPLGGGNDNAGNPTPGAPGGPLTPGGQGAPGTGGDVSAQPLQSSLNSSVGVRQRLVVPPSQQSALYRELVKRYDQRQGNQPVTDQEANRQFNALRRAQAEGQQGKTGDQSPLAAGNPPDPTAGLLPPTPNGANSDTNDRTARPGLDAGESRMPGPGGASGRAVAPSGRTPVRVPVVGPDVTAAPKTAPSDKPIKVTTLAEGIDAAGLRDLMKSAEDLMRQGKFDSAIEKYDTAGVVAVDNPLVTLGRAQAELGATYYRRAENDLRRAIRDQPALLKGQYDLKAFMGQERLQYLVQDLKSLAAKDEKEVRPILLLAYIAYNYGMEAQAADFLAEAERRTNGRDETVRAMRDNWSLPAPASPKPAGAEPPAAELNK